MRWTRMRRDSLFAMVILSATSCLAADSYLSGFSSDTVGVDFSQPATAAFSNSGIDRLLEVNASQDTLLRTSSALSSSTPDAPSNTSAVESHSAAVEIAPFAEATPSGGRGMYVAAGCVAAFAMGLGLCFAGMMTGRKRTINTFTAGFVRIR